MKKIKKILKIIILTLVLSLLCFVIFAGNKLFQYRKVVIARNNLLNADSFKIIVKEHELTDVFESTTRVGIKKGNRASTRFTYKYTEQAKEENPLLKDFDTATFYTRTGVENQYFDNNTMFVSYNDKIFSVYNSTMIVVNLIDSMYPNTIDIIYLGGDENSIYEKYLYLTSVFPLVMKMDFSVVDDEGREAFVVEGERGSFRGDGDKEYSRIRSYYDKDTMIIYKQIAVKPDGTEKLLKEYEITTNVADEELAYPDLTDFRQILEND